MLPSGLEDNLNLYVFPLAILIEKRVQIRVGPSTSALVRSVGQVCEQCGLIRGDVRCGHTCWFVFSLDLSLGAVPYISP